MNDFNLQKLEISASELVKSGHLVHPFGEQQRAWVQVELDWLTWTWKFMNITSLSLGAALLGKGDIERHTIASCINKSNDWVLRKKYGMIYMMAKLEIFRQNKGG